LASLAEDQAAGLRRLFGAREEPVSIAFAGARGASRAGVVAALARALAGAGKEVLVLDENAGAQSVATAFGLPTRYDLLQAVHGDVPLAGVALQADAAIRLVPAARAAREAGRLDAIARRALARCLHRLQEGADVVLVDTAGRDEEASPLVGAPQRVVIVAGANGGAITEAYAHVKRLAQAGCRSFQVVVSRAVGPEEGETVFCNMREVARRHLGVALELLGCAPARGPAGPVWDTMAQTLLRCAPCAARGTVPGGRALAASPA
jgi:MinD-like ATPase involved in chromosome partitioning or flagellar assembly